MISAPLQKAFMLLLRQGLWDRQEDCSALFPLDEKEWNEIHSMARKQTVQGIIYDGIRLLPDEAVPPRKVLLGWMVEVDTLERVNRQHGETLKGLQQIYAQPPSITATQEFVVPKSIPITLLIVFPPKSVLFYRSTPVSATETTVAHQI